MRGSARTKIAKTNMAPIKRQFFCSIPSPYLFFLLTIKLAVEEFSRLLKKYIRKFQDAHKREFCRILRHGSENLIKCTACAAFNTKLRMDEFFDHLDLLGKAHVSQ